MTDWASLMQEFDCWRDAGKVATFWWRDDDAVSDTAELERLFARAGTVPVALSVIPAHADRSLAAALRHHPSAAVLQHGWRHANHSTGVTSEYPAGRDRNAVAWEFIVGFRLLADLFGAQSLPVFAPPWHGFDNCYLDLLAPSGIRAISRKGARQGKFSSSLLYSNVHCVPILWTTTPPSFGADADYLESILKHLQARRLGTCDATEPTGILTHHLVQDERSYEFMSRLVTAVADHPSAAWLGAQDVFELQPARH